MTLGVAPPVGAATPSAAAAACVPTVDAAFFAARVWDEAALDTIRRDLRGRRSTPGTCSTCPPGCGTRGPPTTEARGYFVTEKLDAADKEAARGEAISYAAYRILSHRYAAAQGAEETLAEFDATMASQCYPTDVTTTLGDTPAALGNRIAAAIIDFGLTDGANEQNNYAAPESYAPVDDPLIVILPGATMNDPDRWQPLALEKQVAQNGVPIPGKVQKSVTPFWGHVTSFGLPASPDGTPVLAGEPPRLADAPPDGAHFNDYKASAIRVPSSR